MNNNIENLQKIISVIKKSAEIKGREINDEEIASSANLSEQQLLDLLSGKEKIPNNLITGLLTAFNLDLMPIEDVHYERPDLALEGEEDISE